MFRLLAVLDASEVTLTALFKTNFNIDFPFDVQEFVAFAFIGLTCGLGGAMFVYTHRKIVDISHHNEGTKFNKFLSKSRFIYPALIVVVVATLSFPKGLGMFMAGQLTSREAGADLFSNTTWTVHNNDPITQEILRHWDSEYTNVYITLVVFIIVKFILTAVCVALPIPAGVFFPVFVIGAGYGRLVGECMATWFPDGVRSGASLSPVVPGGYAVVGAAAMAGAVTHTISTSVIVFELTGQITHILPVMVAVLIANAVVQPLQPSIYDSIIEIKKLPNLPDIKRSRHYNVTAGDIMKPVIKYITTQSTYLQLRDLLKKTTDSSFPLVDKPESMILLGSIRRPQLEWLLQRQLLSTPDHANTDNPDGTDDGGRHASVHFSDGEVSVSFPEFKKESRSKRRPKLKRLHTGTPVSLQRLFLSSVSEPGESTLAETLSDGHQIPAWEMELLQEEIDFTDCQIDPAPFQLVERSSLYKTHKMFCLLNLSHAYVTAIGRLVGIVSLNEVREAIENERVFIQRRLTRLQSTAGTTPDPDYTLDQSFESTEPDDDVTTKSRAQTEPAYSPNLMRHESVIPEER